MFFFSSSEATGKIYLFYIFLENEIECFRNEKESILWYPTQILRTKKFHSWIVKLSFKLQYSSKAMKIELCKVLKTKLLISNHLMLTTVKFRVTFTSFWTAARRRPRHLWVTHHVIVAHIKMINASLVLQPSLVPNRLLKTGAVSDQNLL